MFNISFADLQWPVAGLFLAGFMWLRFQRALFGLLADQNASGRDLFEKDFSRKKRR